MHGSHFDVEHSKAMHSMVGRIEASATWRQTNRLEKPCGGTPDPVSPFATARLHLGTVRADGCDYFATVLGPGSN